jgi:heterogeneous nuclear ribonucleoprotein A1/A3
MADDENKSSSTPNTTKIFVGGISWDVTDAVFTSFFSRFGEIKDAQIMRDRATNASRGFGFVNFADPSSVDKVLSTELELDGRKIDAKLAVPKTSIGEAPGLHRTRKVFVGGLAPQVTPDDLKTHFAQFGTIVNAIIMMDQSTQRSRGFGFVTFDSENTVDAVLARSHTLAGKTVECKKAVAKNKISAEKTGRGGGGGGGYGGWGDYPGFWPGPYGFPPRPFPRGPPGFGRGYGGYGGGFGAGGYGGGAGRSSKIDRSFHPYR